MRRKKSIDRRRFLKTTAAAVAVLPFGAQRLAATRGGSARYGQPLVPIKAGAGTAPVPAQAIIERLPQIPGTIDLSARGY